MHIPDLISNISLLLALGLVHSMIMRSWQRQTLLRQLAVGLLFGAVAIAGMLTPLWFVTGLIFDGRSIVLSTAGLFGGPVVALVAAATAAAYRVWLGGVGWVMGVGVIFSSAALGVGYYYLRLRYDRLSVPWCLLLFGLLVHLWMLALLVTTVPAPLSLQALRALALPVLTLYPLATAALCALFLGQEERVAALRALTERERQYRELVNGVKSIVLRWRPDGTITYINAYGAAFFGYTPATLQGRKAVGTIIPPRDADGRDLSPLPGLICQHPDAYHVCQNENMCRDGRRVWIAWTNSVTIDDAGAAAEVLSVGNDITEQHAVADALRQSAAEFQELVASLPCAVYRCVCDRAWTMEYLSDGIAAITGYPASDFLHNRVRSYASVIHPEDAALVDQQVREAIALNQPFTIEYRVRHREGEVRWIWERGRGCGDGGGVARIDGVLIDITDRRQTEDRMRQYVDIVSAMQLGLYVFCLEDPAEDCSLTLVMANPASTTELGLVADELLQRRIDDAFPGLCAQALPARFATVARGGPGFAVDEFEYAQGNHEPRYYDFRAFPLPRNCVGIVFEDVTARRELEQRLRFTQFAFDHAPEAILLIDEHGRFVYVNDTACAMLGYSSEEFRDLSLRDIDPEVTTENWPERWAQARRQECFSLEVRHRCRSGVVVPVDLVANFVTFGGVSYLCAFSRDASERKRMEEQLLQAQKMEAIGTLAGGIAHDFNNIMAVVLGNAEMLFDEVPPTAAAREGLEQIHAASLRARDLVRQILTFSRKTTQELRALHLVPLVREGLKMLRATLPATIEIVEHIACAQDTVLADATQLHQVLVNLCVNARQAMAPAGGALQVSLQTTVLESASADGLVPGTYVELRIGDTGPGMAPQVLERVFDPFYTTKEVGHGTGLGLAVAQGIVKSHHGAISVTSVVDGGTEFRVLLPFHDSAPVAVAARDMQVCGGSGERILLVDDEEAVVRVATRMLDGLGYRVAAATSATEALRQLQADPDAYDLVLTDQTMPHLTGTDLARAVHAVRPAVPVVLCSGYAAPGDAQTVAATHIAAVLMKPFDRQQLAATIRRVLDHAQKGQR